MLDFLRKSYFVRNPAQSGLFLLLSLLASALILRLSGLFFPWIHLVIVGLCVLILILKRPASGSISKRKHSSWFPVGIAGLAILYLSSPGEYLVGNWDPGVYLAQGATAARETGWTVHDSTTDVITPELRTILYPHDRNLPVKVPGFYAPQDKPTRLIPQFYPLYPTLLAVANRVGGVNLAFRVDGLCFLLGILLLADLARRITRRNEAALFCLLLTGLHPVVIWFARFHTSESLLFLLFAVFIWASYRCIVNQRWSDCTIACVSIALLPWVTPSAFPVVCLLPGFLLFRKMKGSQRLSIMGSGLASAMLLVLFLHGVHHPYGRYVLQIIPSIEQLARPLPYQFVLWILASLVILTAGVSIISRKLNAVRFTKNKIIFTSLAAVGIAGVVSYWLAPRLSPFIYGTFTLLPLPFWLFAIAGVIAARKTAPEVMPWVYWILSATLCVTIIFLLWPMVPQHFPWAWKRWIWILLPVITLLATIGVFAIYSNDKFTGNLLVVSAFIILLALPFYYHGRLAQGNEWSGLHEWFEAISESLPEDALIMVPKELATPLDFVYGHTVIPVYRGTDTARANACRALWKGKYSDRPVWLIHWKRPDWLSGADSEPVALPPYTGYWIEQSRRPEMFHRQRRGFKLFVWAHEEETNHE